MDLYKNLVPKAAARYDWSASVSAIWSREANKCTCLKTTRKIANLSHSHGQNETAVRRSGCAKSCWYGRHDLLADGTHLLESPHPCSPTENNKGYDGNVLKAEK